MVVVLVVVVLVVVPPVVVVVLVLVDVGDVHVFSIISHSDVLSFQSYLHVPRHTLSKSKRSEVVVVVGAVEHISISGIQ